MAVMGRCKSCNKFVPLNPDKLMSNWLCAKCSEKGPPLVNNAPKKVNFKEVLDDILEVFQARELIKNKNGPIRQEVKAALEIFFAKNQGNYL